ncbi:hypothetical protein F2P79_008600 [Pimephales promelas]|nr:hypothetical protein F2P79_008600 [Pimephales promelas]
MCLCLPADVHYAGRIIKNKIDNRFCFDTRAKAARYTELDTSETDLKHRQQKVLGTYCNGWQCIMATS